MAAVKKKKSAPKNNRPKGKSPVGSVKKGALRKSLGLSTSKDMPEKDKVIHKGDSKLMRERKVFAQNAKKWNHSGKKG